MEKISKWCNKSHWKKRKVYAMQEFCQHLSMKCNHNSALLLPSQVHTLGVSKQTFYISFKHLLRDLNSCTPRQFHISWWFMISLFSSLIYLWIDIARSRYKTGTESTWITDFKQEWQKLFISHCWKITILVEISEPSWFVSRFVPTFSGRSRGGTLGTRGHSYYR